VWILVGPMQLLVPLCGQIGCSLLVAIILYVMARTRWDVGSNRFCLYQDIRLLLLVKLLSSSWQAVGLR
jgi:hypothetical protein